LRHSGIVESGGIGLTLTLGLALASTIAICDFYMRFSSQELIERIESTFDCRGMFGQLAPIQNLFGSQM
jgi:HAMP domain-containing protein